MLLTLCCTLGFYKKTRTIYFPKHLVFQRTNGNSRISSPDVLMSFIQVKCDLEFPDGQKFTPVAARSRSGIRCLEQSLPGLAGPPGGYGHPPEPDIGTGGLAPPVICVSRILRLGLPPEISTTDGFPCFRFSQTLVTQHPSNHTIPNIPKLQKR